MRISPFSYLCFYKCPWKENILKCCVIDRGASWNPTQDWGQLLYRCCPASSNLLRVSTVQRHTTHHDSIKNLDSRSLISCAWTHHTQVTEKSINHGSFCEAVTTSLSQVQSSRYPALYFLKDKNYPTSNFWRKIHQDALFRLQQIVPLNRKFWFDI